MKDLIALHKPQSTFRLIRALCRTMGKTKWEFRSLGFGNCSIRASGQDDLCPLAFAATVATGRTFSSSWPCRAGERIGMDTNLIADVVLGADGGRLLLGPQMRRILLKSAGLTEPPKI